MAIARVMLCGVCHVSRWMFSFAVDDDLHGVEAESGFSNSDPFVYAAPPTRLHGHNRTGDVMRRSFGSVLRLLLSLVRASVSRAQSLVTVEVTIGRQLTIRRSD
jgi:hypothetical protein